MDDELIKLITQKARKSKPEETAPNTVGKSQAQRAAIRKLMAALKSEDDERFLQAYTELKTADSDEDD